ncbi:IclR family transcriptional regulator [Nocardia sp. 2]|uniref:IclR family transcriptional regulator n=1 Tax=Nocardia acididurans TaxID=2802282 RepID=A0ABS1M0U6_9NOCA|nr:IclR family transcriptional regulator [Nocardia acididurans]MBL1073825.1 IclR family transcriptional regulator [Nocardia acididurans]
MAKNSNGESTISRAVRLVSAFTAEEPELTVTELSHRTGMSPPTVSRLVAELAEHGWLRRDAAKRVRIGVRMWEVAVRAAPVQPLRDAALPVMAKLHNTFRHPVHLGVSDGGDVLFVARQLAVGVLPRDIRLPMRVPLHASASGLVLLAYASQPVRAAYLSRLRHPDAKAASPDPDGLGLRLDEIRRRGFAVWRSERQRATAAGVPIRGGDGRVIAALSILALHGGVGPDTVSALRSAGAEIQLELESGPR